MNKKLILLFFMFVVLLSSFSIVTAQGYSMTNENNISFQGLLKTAGYYDGRGKVYMMEYNQAQVWNLNPIGDTGIGGDDYFAISAVNFMGYSSYYNEMVYSREGEKFYHTNINEGFGTQFTTSSLTPYKSYSSGGVTDEYFFYYNEYVEKFEKYEFSTDTFTTINNPFTDKVVGVDSYKDGETWYILVLTTNSDESNIKIHWMNEDFEQVQEQNIEETFIGANIYSYDNSFFVDRDTGYFYIYTSQNEVSNDEGILEGGCGTFYIYKSDSTLQPPLPPQNFIYENIAYVKQEQPVGITESENYQTIGVATYNITENFTGYATATFNSFSNAQNGYLSCRINFNGEYYNSTLIRTDSDNNVYGSWYLLTDEIHIEPQILNASLECKVEDGEYNILNNIGILHFTKNIPSYYSNGNYTAVNNAYTEVNLGNITIPDEEAYIENNYFFVYEGVSELSYNSDSEVEIKIEIDGVNHTTGNRTGELGDYGIYGKYFGQEINGYNRTFEIKGYVKGDVNAFYKSYGKLFLLNKKEYYHKENITSLVDNTNFEKIENFTYESEDISNIVVNAVLPVQSNSANDILEARIVLEDNNGTTFLRSLKTDTEKGILMVSEVFEQLENNTQYNISLEVRAENNDITINKGSIVMYRSDVDTFTLKAINITAYDSNSLEQINNFSVETSDGINLETTTGNILFSSSKGFESFNVSSNEYYNTIVLNHNLNNNLNVSMNEILYYIPTITGVCDSEITLPLDNNLIYRNISVYYNEEPPISETVSVFSRREGLVNNDIFMYSEIVEGVNNTYNYGFKASSFPIGTYNISTSHNIQGLYQEQVSNCSFSICKNDWERIPTACVNGIRTINYTDNNECEEKYYPEDYGLNEYCDIEENNQKRDFQYMIIGFIAFIVFIVMGYIMKEFLFYGIALVPNSIMVGLFFSLDNTIYGVISIFLLLINVILILKNWNR